MQILLREPRNVRISCYHERRLVSSFLWLSTATRKWHTHTTSQKELLLGSRLRRAPIIGVPPEPVSDASGALDSSGSACEAAAFLPDWSDASLPISSRLEDSSSSLSPAEWTASSGIGSADVWTLGLPSLSEDSPSFRAISQFKPCLRPWNAATAWLGAAIWPLWPGQELPVRCAPGSLVSLASAAVVC